MKLLGEPKDKVEKAENLEKAKKIFLSFPEAAGRDIILHFMVQIDLSVSCKSKRNTYPMNST